MAIGRASWSVLGGDLGRSARSPAVGPLRPIASVGPLRPIACRRPLADRLPSAAPPIACRRPLRPIACRRAARPIACRRPSARSPAVGRSADRLPSATSSLDPG